MFSICRSLYSGTVANLPRVVSVYLSDVRYKLRKTNASRIKPRHETKDPLFKNLQGDIQFRGKSPDIWEIRRPSAPNVNNSRGPSKGKVRLYIGKAGRGFSSDNFSYLSFLREVFPENLSLNLWWAGGETVVY